LHNNTSTCAGRYERLSALRETYLNRARESAKLTIPTLIPESGHGVATKFATPYQGIGARGVNNLASKLLLSLLPPNSPFFQMKIDDFTAEELAQEEGARAKVDEALNKYERAVMTDIENSGTRSAVFEALKHLIVGGNTLVYLPKDGGARVFPLHRYVVKRDPMGEVLEVIIKEDMSRASLPQDVLDLLAEQTPSEQSPEDDLPMFTKLYRDGNKFKLYQEIEGIVIPDSHGEWPVEKSPMIALRWTRVDGEDYGRSYVEEYLGDLISLEGLSKAVLEASAVSAKVVFMVAPNGTTRAKDIAEVANGGIVSGNAAEVSTLQVNKQADMSVAQSSIQVITERLGYAFLMNSAVQRNGERVTAEEVRYMAGELEDALGGVYSILSQEFQLPFVSRIIDRMTKKKTLPALPKGVVKPTIVTGLEALGRGHDLNKYNMFLQALTPLGPEVIAKYMNAGDYVKRVGTALGIDMNGLVKDDEQQAQEQQMAEQQAQEQQMMEMAKGAIPAMAKEGAGLARDVVQPQQG
tara:strand:+ start:958 stop:2526 length:1569 start_codon:yes stop_codon:yes gene_type:complete